MFIRIIKYLKEKISFKKKIEPFFTKDLDEFKKFEIGDFTYGSPVILDWGEGATLKIGRFCSIAENVSIFLGGNHRMDWLSTYPFNKIKHFRKDAGHIKGHPQTKGDVIIGHDVWIGWGAVIMSGVKIGNGAVVGAYAVVTKDIQPYEVVAGNPAKHIKFRFDENTIDILMKNEWWNLNENQIKELIPILCNNDIMNYKRKLI